MVLFASYQSCCLTKKVGVHRFRVHPVKFPDLPAIASMISLRRGGREGTLFNGVNRSGLQPLNP